MNKITLNGQNLYSYKVLPLELSLNSKQAPTSGRIAFKFDGNAFGSLEATSVETFFRLDERPPRRWPPSRSVPSQSLISVCSPLTWISRKHAHKKTRKNPRVIRLGKPESTKPMMIPCCTSLSFQSTQPKTIRELLLYCSPWASFH